MDVELARSKMLGQQVRAWDVLDTRVLEILGAVPRERFVPERFRNLAFAEVPLPLGHGESMMEPAVEGRLLQALALRPTDRVLEIGTGSGFLTACLARSAASVVSLDIHAEFTERARAKLTAQGIRNVTLSTQDASRLGTDLGRFDAIAVTGSLPAFDLSFQAHLAVGGRLFMVIGAAPAMDALLVTRTAEAVFTRESLFETDLAPLRNAKAPSRFQL